MPLWLLLAIVALVKIPLAALLLWVPLRSDDAMNATHDAGSAPQPPTEEGDGGGRVTRSPPRHPRPRHPLPAGPRRDPHRSGSTSAPARARTRTHLGTLEPAGGRLRTPGRCAVR